MKHLILSCFFFIFCFSLTEAQTDANIPGPENVLVVYKMPSDTTDSLGIVSESIKNYYVNKHSIPATNIVPGLDLPRKIVNLNDGTGDHVVKLDELGEIIVDSTRAVYDSTHVGDTATFHAWQYFIDEIADPIAAHIDSNNLSETIRYIVMCRGVPYKIQARGNWSQPGNVNVNGLLCMLNTQNYEDFLGDVFSSYIGAAFPYPFLSNPYYDEDEDYDMDSRFEPDHYSGNWSGHNYKLSYLVSRLDGLSLEIIKDVIDRSVSADKSGNDTWILDAGGPGSTDMYSAYVELDNLGFDTEYNSSSSNWITTCTNDVMGYTSAGTHQGMDSSYIQDTLDFNYANGAIFNTYESYNGYSMGSLTRSGNGQGLITEFLKTGGTGCVGHTWEPYATYVIKDAIFFPSYAMGYGMVDAAYLGLPYLAWRNVIVGDPLTTIAFGKQELLSNTIWKDTILVTDTIDVPLSKSLTVRDGALIKFEHNGFVTGEGDFVVDSSFTFVISSWNRALFLSSENDHPKLLWGNHPSIGSATHYEIFRKFDDDGRWTAIDTVTNHKFVDTAVTINDPNQGFGTNVYYKIKSYKAPSTYSAFSNTIKVNVEEDELPKEYIAGTKFDYNLFQNYPNPFNPSTSIKYSVKNAGTVSLIIFDILGNKVAELVNETQSPGNYKVQFNASNYASGIYFYRLQVNDFVSIKKMILMK